MAVGPDGFHRPTNSGSYCHCYRHGGLCVVLDSFGDDDLNLLDSERQGHNSDFKKFMNNASPSELMLKCACHTEALEITHLPNEDKPDEFWFSIWENGFDSRLSRRERFRWCWNILRTGRPWGDNIILTPEQAMQVAKFILKHADSNENVKTTL